MKKATLKALPLLFSFALAVPTAYGQTKEQRKATTLKYNVEKLEKLSESFKKESNDRKKAALQMAAQKGWETFITNKDGSVDELMDVSRDGHPIYYTVDNVDAAKSTRADHLNIGGSLGLNLDGQNMVAYVWDGGATRTTHQEFDGPGGNNRVSIIDGVTSLNSNSFHAQHVTGTIVASGFVAAAKGMAPQAQAKTADWNNDLSEATTQAANGMLISNHSYGYRASGIPDWYFGAYISESRDWDELMHNSPYYLMVVAAGNDGADNSSNGSPLNGNSSFDKLSGHSTSKNNIVVANAQDANVNADGTLNSVVINNGSSEGPTDDLRIKPDITGNGTGLYSSDSGNNSDYATLTGTSMASPNVTGSLLLLQQHYNNLNGAFMRSATLKGLALHTADDAGITGPDAVYGWGLLNTKVAAEVLSANGNGAIVDELTLNPGQTYTITVDADGVSPLMASISWTDLPGTANTGTANQSTPVLVNDLDIRVVKNSTTYFPYKLTGVNSNTQADNNVDPYERIAVNNASGSYTITVTHKGSLSGGSQDFSLIVTGVTSEPVVCEANVPNNLAVGSIETTSASLTWDAVPAATYDVRYRAVGAPSWTTVSVNPNAYSLSGLSPETQYEVQVRSKCDGGETSTYSSSEVFTTPEVVLNYCTSQGNNSSYEYIQSVALGAFTNNSGNNNGYADFTSSVISINKDEATSFTLTPGFPSSSYNETWKLFADLNKDGDFDDAGETLYTSANVSSAVSGSITIPSSAITGTTRLRVSMKYNSAPSPCESFSYGEVEDYTLNIQDDVAEPCDAPSGLTTSNATTNSIDVSWASVSNASSYLLQHRVSGGTWSTQTVSGPSATVSGLNANTTYDFRVASDCGNETSAYSNATSATTDEEAPVCDAPVNLQSSNVTTSSFTVSWNAVSGASEYIVDFRVSGGSWGSTTSASNSINLTGGSPNTTYEVRVKTDCGSGLESNYSATITLTTDEEAPVCDAPTNLQSSNVGINSFDASWSAVSGAVSYNVDIRPAGGSWTTQTASTNSLSFSGLTANTTYEVRVQTECSAINSAYSSVISVTTDEEPVTAEYCDASGNNSSQEWIQSVSFGNNTYTTGNNGGYHDNTSTVINLTPGGSIYIELNPGFTNGLFWTNSYPEYWNLWIDFNNDGDFEDAGELWASTNGTYSGSVSGTVAIPSGVSGTTRMRIAMKRNTGAASCGTFDRGEVEDYTVNFGSAMTQDYNVIASNHTSPGLLKGNISFGVAPNPTNDAAKLSLTISPYQGDVTISIMDVTGRTVNTKVIDAVSSTTSQQLDLDLSEQGPGTYMINVKTASGESTTQRLVKY